MFVNKKDFDKEFNLKVLPCNNLLTIKIMYDTFYCVVYDEIIYNRFIKILTLAPNETIRKYIKIIKYSKKYGVKMTDIFAAAGAK